MKKSMLPVVCFVVLLCSSSCGVKIPPSTPLPVTPQQSDPPEERSPRPKPSASPSLGQKK